jgi:D-alanine transaminase
MTPSNLVYLNGRFIPPEEACVPVMDRGFLFGDSVYEVIPAYGVHLFRFTEHLDRLDRSLGAIGMTNPLSRTDWRQVMETLLGDPAPDVDQSIYLQVTRGVSATRDHVVPDDATPTVVAMARPLPAMTRETRAAGLAAITLEDIRWHRCDIKTTSLLANVLGRQKARETGAQEAILVRDGQVTEGAASNLFIVSNGLVITPPNSHDLLPGITRDLVLELAAGDGIPYAEAAIGMAELEQADEIWISSSSKEIMPVVQLNGVAVGNGTAGPLWHRAYDLFDAYKARLKLQ